MNATKSYLYEQVARIGKAVASPKRLELVELLCQGEKTVEALAAQAEVSVKLASAHLKELRLARLVETRKDGKYVLYRLAGTSVADLWVALRSQAEERLVELQVALASLVEHRDDLEGLDRKAILKKAKTGEVLGKTKIPDAQELRLIEEAESLVTEAVQKTNTFFNGKWKEYQRLVEGTPMKIFDEYKPVE